MNNQTDIKNCCIEGCNKPTRSKKAEWCEMHYIRNRRHGSPHTKLTMQYHVHEKALDVINDDVAWLIGVLCSDGWVVGNQIGIKSKDLEMVQQVKRVLGTNQKIKRCKTGDKEYYALIIANKPLVDALAFYNVVENKSLIVKYPEKLPNEYFGAFFRGMIDGDGSITFTKKRKNQKVKDCSVQFITASLSMSTEIRDRLKDLNISFTLSERYRSINPVWEFQIRRRDSLIKLHKTIYPSLDVCCLKRKRKVLDEWISTPRQRVGRPTKDIEL